jgi:hypothetical protein
MYDPGLGGAFQNGRPVGVEIFQIKVAVGVSKYHVSGYPVSDAPVVDDTWDRNT